VKVPGGEIELRDDRMKSKWKAEIRPFVPKMYWKVRKHRKK
jgi:hypothetical protein